MVLVTQIGHTLFHDKHRYVKEKVSGSESTGNKRIAWVCFRRTCRGRVQEFPVGTYTLRNGFHTCNYNDAERNKDRAMERLRELTLEAGDGVNPTDIVDKLLNELSPDTRSPLEQDKKRLERSVRRWANGADVVRTTFENYSVETSADLLLDGGDAAQLPPQLSSTESSSNASDTIIKNEPVAGPSEGEIGCGRKSELIFLEGLPGEKPRVKIEDKIYLWTRDLTNGGSAYKCQEASNGCRVSVKVYRGKTQYYEIRGTHFHQPPRPPPAKKLSRNSLKLVDEEGNDLGRVSLDHILTAGEDCTELNLDYDNLPRIGSTAPDPSGKQLPTGDGSILSDSNDVAEAGEDFPMNYDYESELETTAEEVSISRKMLQGSSATIPAQEAVKSGEKCFMCGDDLLTSEKAMSANQETFRKACRYLNVKSESGWISTMSSDRSFNSFCESCTNEIRRIHQLYKEVDKIQSLIFQKVEHVEKRIADAVIIDNWLDEASPTSAIRLEGFRKQVLINYRNKLKMRREIRVGRKLGHNFTEIYPTSSARMFASDPAATKRFRRTMTMPIDDSEDGQNEASPTDQPTILNRGPRRPKSKNREQSAEPYFLAEQGPLKENTCFVTDEDYGDFHNVDDATSVTSEREMKFWERDPSKLQFEIGDDENGNYRQDEADVDTTSNKSDPDYNYEDEDSDEDWVASNIGKGRERTGKRKANLTEQTNAAGSDLRKEVKRKSERLSLAKGNKPSKATNKKTVDIQTKGPKPQRKKRKSEDVSGKFKFPDAVLRKDGRVFMSGIEIIKNAPTASKQSSYTCGACGKITLGFSRTREHICGHHLGMFKCTICLKQFSNPVYLSNHEEFKHSGKTTNFNHCPICGKPFTRSSTLRYHRWSHLSEEEKNDPQYKTYCPPQIRDPNRKKRSEGFQTFMCSYCPKTFFQTGPLRKHEMGHNGEGPTFMCQYCGKIYNSKKSLHGHTQTCFIKSKGIKSLVTYPCPKCPVRFKSRAVRNKHVKKFHSNVKDPSLPFCCPKCPRSFSTRDTFKSHKRICIEDPSNDKIEQNMNTI